jgi:4-hydroxythreonine-4-phosphate dehydrogenase
MKIYVTQGHEKGIGLEVFFKTCLFLSENELKKISLIAFKKSVSETLKSLFQHFILNEDHILMAGQLIPVIWLDQIHHSESFSALELGMKLSETDGVLYTLPTSKDQFPGFSGHTEYFRHFYRTPDLGMYFSSSDLKVLLLSDHVPLKNLPEIMNAEAIYEKILCAAQAFKKWSWPLGSFLVAGLNPHAGENGLIGREDEQVSLAIRRISDKHSFIVKGPFPADTMLMERKSAHDVLVYLFHDQGLGVFKSRQGFLGSNITLGLKYPRFSPDHGTSFSLFGKNLADYRGCAFSLKEALQMLKRFERNGQNTSYQS